MMINLLSAQKRVINCHEKKKSITGTPYKKLSEEWSNQKRKGSFKRKKK